MFPGEQTATTSTGRIYVIVVMVTVEKMAAVVKVIEQSERERV